MNKLKKYGIPFLLSVILLGLGFYFLNEKTEVVDTVVYKIKLLIEPKPEPDSIHYYFQQENAISLGSVDFQVDSKESSKYYAFILYRLGVPTLTLVPEDFNLEDLNHKSFTTINSGSKLSDQTNYDTYVANTVELFDKDMNASGTGLSTNEGNIVLEGIGREFSYKYVKIIDYNKENVIHFYMDKFNKFSIDLDALDLDEAEYVVAKETLINY